MLRRLDLEDAVLALSAGKLIVTPSESIYGLSCDPFNIHALESLLNLKKRSANKGLICIGSSLEHFVDLIAEESPKKALDLAKSNWPGPTTFLLPARQGLAVQLKGLSDMIALRITAHPILVALCQRYGGPLVSSSANLAGEPPARSLEDLAPLTSDAVLGVLCGELGSEFAPSAIINAATGEVVRPGPRM